MPISRPIEFVPPEVVYRREPLPDERNAWFPWKEAVEAVSLPESNEDGTDLISRLFWGDPESGEPVNIETDSERAYVAELLERNRRVLELVDEGIRRGRFWSPDCEFEAVRDDNVSLLESGDVVFRLVPRVRTLLALRTKLARAQRDLDSVADRLIDFLRIGNIICTSDSSSIDFILGVGFQMGGYSRIHRLVSQENLPRHILQRLLSATMDQHVTNEDVIRCVCVDMVYDGLNRIDQVPESADFDTVFEHVVRLHYYNDLSTALFFADECGEDSDSVSTLQQQIEWRREKLRYLLEGHPCLFAKKKTAEFFGQQVLDWAKRLRASDSESNGMLPSGNDDPHGIFKIWPAQLQPGVAISLLGDSDFAREHRRMVEEVIDTEAVEGWQQWANPPTDAELEAARGELRAIDNPIGRMLVKTTMNPIIGVISTNQLREYSREAISLLRERLGQV
ncbi:MAG TPA: hypothetical protein DD670_16265 [Planctomycetaceae bacterium]|nr:hypothetical protein [Planctomycetaceae bacterium]